MICLGCKPVTIGLGSTRSPVGLSTNLADNMSLHSQHNRNFFSRSSNRLAVCSTSMMVSNSLYMIQRGVFRPHHINNIDHRQDSFRLCPKPDPCKQLDSSNEVKIVLFREKYSLLLAQTLNITKSQKFDIERREVIQHEKECCQKQGQGGTGREIPPGRGWSSLLLTHLAEPRVDLNSGDTVYLSQRAFVEASESPFALFPHAP